MAKTPKLGDYIISKEKEIYRIVNVDHYPNYSTYTIKNMKSYMEHTETYSYQYYREIRGLDNNELYGMGTIIPEEEASKVLKLLYES